MTIFTSPFVRVAQLAKRLDATYPTAKSDIERFVQAGILHELPNVTPKTFYAPDVFKVSYGELGTTANPLATSVEVPPQSKKPTPVGFFVASAPGHTNFGPFV